jgi:hypothetical protein
MTYVTHINACIFCFIGIAEIRSGSLSWIEQNNLNFNCASRLYIIGFYWALYSICTVGYGNIAIISNIERMFAIFVMLVGSIMVISVIFFNYFFNYFIF